MVKAPNTNADDPDTSPSRPSVKFTAFEVAVIMNSTQRT